MGPGAARPRDAMDDRLRAELDDAREELQRASAIYRRLMPIARDVDPSSPDGTLALRQALRAKQNALERYMRALRSFNDFLLR